MINNKNLIELINELKKRNLTISSVESFTGGLFSSSLTSIPGSSKVFYGALTTYFTDAKIKVLKADADIINKYGVVSKETSIEMAIKGEKLFNTDIVISFTGNAGPTVCEDNKKCGECYSSIFYKNEIYSYSFMLSEMERNEIREKCVNDMTINILKLLKKDDKF